jgi:valyl-tRNA synthetase
MTEKRQTSQGYIIRILQHFATKLWNITNFVMLFQAMMKFLSRSKFQLYGERSIVDDPKAIHIQTSLYDMIRTV